MEEKVLKTIKKYSLIEENDKVIVGVSGGPDSLALLNILMNLKKQEKLKIEIIVCHINHGLRKEAEEEQIRVERFCNMNDIPCYTKKVKIKEIAENNRIGTEEAGRNVRYAFFYEIADKEKANKIATAHTANDNAETVLMNIIRGSGIAGLKGIERKRNNVIRPLIECSREKIEEYCKKNDLHPSIDQSNFENIYTRNKVRNLLIPYIKENFNPNIVQSINRLSSLAAQENEYIQKQVKQNYFELLEEKSDTQISLNLKKFNLLETVIKSRIVLYTMNELFGTQNGIEKKHIEDIIKLCSHNIGNKYLIPNKKVKVLVKNKKIFFIANK